MTTAGCQPIDRIHHPAGRTHSAFRRVLVRVRIAEIGKNAVPQEFGEIAIVAGDHAGADVLIRTHDLAHVLRIGASSELGRADEISKHQCELPPLAIVPRLDVWGAQLGRRDRYLRCKRLGHMRRFQHIVAGGAQLGDGL